jgi:hypothetical protein
LKIPNFRGSGGAFATGIEEPGRMDLGFAPIDLAKNGMMVVVWEHD